MERTYKKSKQTYVNWVIGLIAFSFLAWGYSYSDYPGNLILISVGAALFLALLGGLFVVSSKKQKNKDKNTSNQNEYANKSTVQGGSDYGQGSSYLAGDSYKQGSTKNDGSNYDNEKGFRSE